MGGAEGAAGTAAAGVTGAGLAEVPLGGGAGLPATGLEKGAMAGEARALEHVIHA